MLRIIVLFNSCKNHCEIQPILYNYNILYNFIGINKRGNAMRNDMCIGQLQVIKTLIMSERAKLPLHGVVNKIVNA
jgi:hypothetical protein